MNFPKIPVGRICNAVAGGIQEMAALALGRRIQTVPSNATQLACYLVDQMGMQDGGPAAFDRDVAIVVLALACNLEEGPPRSWGDLLTRLDFHRLSTACGVESMRGITEDDVERVAVRCQALRCRLGEAFGNSTRFKSTDAGILPRRLCR
jgi:hypothetical protein